MVPRAVLACLPALLVVGCPPSAPVGVAEAGEVAAVPGPVVAPSLVEGERRFYVECTHDRALVSGSATGVPPTGTVTSSLVAVDGATTLWRHRIGTMPEGAGATDCATFGTAIDHVSRATLAGLPALLAHGVGGAWYVLDPNDGAAIVDRLWERSRGLAPAVGPFVVVGAERIAVNAAPGHAVRIRVRNDGPPIAVEAGHRRLELEAPRADGTFALLTRDGASGGALGVLARGATFDLFVSAAGAKALREEEVRGVFLVVGLDEGHRPTRPGLASVALPR